MLDIEITKILTFVFSIKTILNGIRSQEAQEES